MVTLGQGQEVCVIDVIDIGSSVCCCRNRKINTCGASNTCVVTFQKGVILNVNQHSISLFLVTVRGKCEWNRQFVYVQGYALQHYFVHQRTPRSAFYVCSLVTKRVLYLLKFDFL